MKSSLVRIENGSLGRFWIQHYLPSNRVITTTFWADKIFPPNFIKKYLFICVICTAKSLFLKQAIFWIHSFSKQCITSQDSFSPSFIFYCWYSCHVYTYSKNYISIKEVFATKMLYMNDKIWEACDTASGYINMKRSELF